MEGDALVTEFEAVGPDADCVQPAKIKRINSVMDKSQILIPRVEIRRIAFPHVNMIALRHYIQPNVKILFAVDKIARQCYTYTIYIPRSSRYIGLFNGIERNRNSAFGSGRSGIASGG